MFEYLNHLKVLHYSNPIGNQYNIQKMIICIINSGIYIFWNSSFKKNRKILVNLLHGCCLFLSQTQDDYEPMVESAQLNVNKWKWKENVYKQEIRKAQLPLLKVSVRIPTKTLTLTSTMPTAKIHWQRQIKMINFNRHVKLIQPFYQFDYFYRMSLCGPQVEISCSE